MIHRINSVAPDLDDRVIKPNQARSATNLRFGASTDDSNLSGGILVNGMEKLPFNPNVILPDGSSSSSTVIGVKEDYENGYVYYAIFGTTVGRGGDPAHSICRIEVATNNIEYVVKGGWLNFSLDSNVSMAVIDGLLYWTDGINEPRMVNVAKAIRTFSGLANQTDVYPIPNQNNLWCFSQIKRNPQGGPLVFVMNPMGNISGSQTLDYWFSTDSTDKYINKTWLNAIPSQFSYYYIYDNNEESRLAPWSDAQFFIQNLRVSIDLVELTNYCDPSKKTIIKYIVFVMRTGNDGVPYNIKKFNVSDIVIPPTNQGTATGLPILDIENIDSLSKTPTPSSIYDQRYDSVPLLSATNEIANNILNHGNVILDYSDFGDIKIESANPVNVNNSAYYNSSYPASQIPHHIFQTFRPDSNYTIGIQLIDEYGRTTPVLSSTTVYIPPPIVNAVESLSVNPAQNEVVYPQVFYPSIYNDDLINNQYNVDVKISGSLPSWAKYIRLACTKNNTVNFFHKTICRIYYWYQEREGENVFIRSSYDTNYFKNTPEIQTIKNIDNTDRVYTFKGYGIELAPDFPFLYDAAEEQYLKIGREYYSPTDPIPNTGAQAEAIEYKIVGQFSILLLIREDRTNVKFYTGYSLGDTLLNTQRVFPLWYQIEVYTKKKTQETIFYDTKVNIPSEFYANRNNQYTATLYGDCYISYFKKTFTPSIKPYIVSLDFRFSHIGFVDSGYTVIGHFYSMNLTNIYNENWQSSWGLENIAQGPNYKQSILKTSISFSNRYIRNTVINGLNKFNPLDIRQAPAENGPISALVVTNATQQEPGVMLAIGALGISSFYYGAIQLTSVDGSSNIATTDQHLASQRPLLGQFGTSQPASITKTPLSTVYWWSDVVNDFIRYTQAGLERLGLTYSFNNKLREKATGKRVVTGYDQLTDEAILVPQGTESFVFGERFKTFQGFREYSDATGDTPERVMGMATKTYYFLNGFVYVSDVNSAKNKFFDRTVNPKLTIVTNEYPSVVKQWNSIKVYGSKPSQTDIEVGSGEGFYLASKIQPSWWIQRKGEYDAAIRRAIAQPTDSGLSGKVMESRILYSTFVFDANSFTKLNFIEVKSNSAITQ